MKIGDYTLYSIETSKFGLDGGAMFGIIPKPLWEKENPADAKNRIEMVTRSLLLESDDRKILIDTGNGTKWKEKFKAIYNIDTDSVNLKNSLKKVGLSPEDITDVICSHLHFDHVGGNTEIKDEQIVSAFPNANFWIHEKNWILANSPGEKDQGSFMETDWKVLAENDQIRFIKDTPEFPDRYSLLPNVDVMISHGHTTGQLIPVIFDGEKTLVYTADLIPTSSHIPIPWIMAYDIMPMTTIQEKKQLLDLAQKEGWIFFFEHDANIKACTIGFDGKHFHKNQIIHFN